MVRRRQDRVTFLAAVLALATVLLAVPVKDSKAPSHGDSGSDVTVAWVSGASRVEIIADGFRGRSAVEVRVGSQSRTQARADGAGVLRLQVALDEAVVGRAGISVTVVGRAPSGSARALIGAVPPRAGGTGPVDLMPWSVGAALVAVAVATALPWYRRRIRRRSKAETATKPNESPIMIPNEGVNG